MTSPWAGLVGSPVLGPARITGTDNLLDRQERASWNAWIRELEGEIQAARAARDAGAFVAGVDLVGLHTFVVTHPDGNDLLIEQTLGCRAGGARQRVKHDTAEFIKPLHGRIPERNEPAQHDRA